MPTATTAMDIDYPVALDSDYAIWDAFDNHYWPALYFVDRDGIIRDHHFGEGRYEHSERVIQKLLGLDRELVSVEGAGVEADGRLAPSALARDVSRLARQRAVRAAGPEGLRRNDWTLAGAWTEGPERLALDEAGGSIAYRFHARDAHLVLSAGKNASIPFRVLLDGEPPGESHGLDVDANGNGVLREGRMYQLIRQPGRIDDRTLEITFLEPGAEAYVFTFG